MKVSWTWIAAGLAALVVAYLWLKPNAINVNAAAPAAPNLLSFFPGGPGSALNQTAVENQFRDLSTYASSVKDAVTKNPSLGLVLGLTPQQTDYLSLDSVSYQKRYTNQPTSYYPI